MVMRRVHHLSTGLELSRSVHLDNRSCARVYVVRPYRDSLFYHVNGDGELSSVSWFLCTGPELSGHMCLDT